MNLYVPNAQLDAPFGYGDLEWLYRQQDVDGGSLVSRLAQLAPVSFTNPIDGQRRRRLFALDSWEMNNFAWTNDNPGNPTSRTESSSTTPGTTRGRRWVHHFEREPSSRQCSSVTPSSRAFPTLPTPRRRRPRRWPSETRRSTSITRCRSPTIPTSRSARSGSAIPTRRSRRSCRRARSIRPRSWRSSAST